MGLLILLLFYILIYAQRIVRAANTKAYINTFVLELHCSPSEDLLYKTILKNYEPDSRPVFHNNAAVNIHFRVYLVRIVDLVGGLYIALLQTRPNITCNQLI